MLRYGIITASDRSARRERPDESGPTLVARIQSAGGSVVKQMILPDDRRILSQKMIEWSDGGEIDILLITGGTGFGPRDVTPEATREVIQREAPGLAEAMRAASLRLTPFAMLSRSVAGIRGRTLIIDLPGSPKGAVENLEVILPVLEHAVKLLNEENAGH